MDDDRTSLGSALPDGSPHADGASSQAENTKTYASADGTPDPSGVEGGASDGQSVPMARGKEAEDVSQNLGEGVTAEAAEGSFRPPGQLGQQKLKELFTKMVIGVVDGPKPSGNGKAVRSTSSTCRTARTSAWS